MSVISIFGSSQLEPDTVDYNEAFLAGKLLSEAGFDVATGAYKGIMEAALKGTSSTGKTDCIGVTTEEYIERKKNDFVKTEIKTKTYLERLNRLIDIADGYIVFSGGTGTLLELAAIWTLRHRKDIYKPIACIGEQWQEVVQTMCFYSEKTIEEIPLLNHFDDAKNAVDFIIHQLQKK